jgi:endonuclease/exonuclease/phosphatase family metal-dependent hydrolase
MDHARRLAVLVDAVKSDRVLVAGDFNALPPEARQKSGFVDEPEMNFEHDETIAIARKIAGVSEVLADEAAFTFPADGPTRRLDYIFHRPGLMRLSAKVVRSPADRRPLSRRALSAGRALRNRFAIE